MTATLVRRHLVGIGTTYILTFSKIGEKSEIGHAHILVREDMSGILILWDLRVRSSLSFDFS